MKVWAKFKITLNIDKKKHKSYLWMKLSNIIDYIFNFLNKTNSKKTKSSLKIFRCSMVLLSFILICECDYSWIIVSYVTRMKRTHFHAVNSMGELGSYSTITKSCTKTKRWPQFKWNVNQPLLSSKFHPISLFIYYFRQQFNSFIMSIMSFTR